MKPTDILSPLPNHARVWLFAAERPLTLEEHEFTCARLSHFVAEWKAHGTKLAADAIVLHNRFVVIAVDEENQNATGCSVDTCMHEMQAISKAIQVDFFNRLQVVYRDADNGLVVSSTLAHFKEMIAEGDVHAETPVFDTTLQTLGQLRTAFEVPAKNTWLNKFFAAETERLKA
jgi:hypothetical protein